MGLVMFGPVMEDASPTRILGRGPRVDRAADRSEQFLELHKVVISRLAKSIVRVMFTTN